jgi:hypothetical protein
MAVMSSVRLNTAPRCSQPVLPPTLNTAPGGRAEGVSPLHPRVPGLARVTQPVSSSTQVLSSVSYGNLQPLPAFSLPQIDLYAGALFVHICLGWNFYLSTVLTLVITALYTIAGMLPMAEWVRAARGTCLPTHRAAHDPTW